MGQVRKNCSKHSKRLCSTMFIARTLLQTFVFSIALFVSLPIYANRYTIDANTTVVGTPASVLAKHQDTVYSLAVKYSVGAAAFANANPDVDPLLPGEGVLLHLPQQIILPAVKRVGIVVNLAEMRLYYFPPGESAVYIYPVGIGRQGWETPVMQSVISSIKKNPVWTPPASIHEEYQAAGLSLPRRVEAGPDNPLGEFALRIGNTNYLIHGTNRPEGVGLRVSHGCIRLYADHISELSAMISLDTPVNIINEPIKLGRRGDAIYVQAYKTVISADRISSVSESKDALAAFKTLAESTLTVVELESVKRAIKEALTDGSLYTGLVLKSYGRSEG